MNGTNDNEHHNKNIIFIVKNPYFHVIHVWRRCSFYVHAVTLTFARMNHFVRLKKKHLFLCILRAKWTSVLWFRHFYRFIYSLRRLLSHKSQVDNTMAEKPVAPKTANDKDLDDLLDSKYIERCLWLIALMTGANYIISILSKSFDVLVLLFFFLAFLVGNVINDNAMG